MRVAVGQTAIARFAERLVRRRGIHHAVVGAMSGDGTSRAVSAAGPAAPDGSPMLPDTPFHYASVTKLYTATAVMQLWERDEVDLDAAIDTYLPRTHTDGIHRLDGIDHSAAITVRHLLSHTSGLPDYFLATPPGGTSFADRIEHADLAYTLDDVLEAVRRLTPYFPPQDPAAARQRARYSDTNFQLLGAIVAGVTGHTVQQTIEAQILDPLDLHDTWFAGHPRHGRTSSVASIWSGDTALDRPQAMASMAAEGGLIGTAIDAVRFLRALTAGDLFERRDTFAHMGAQWHRFGLPRDRAAMMAPGWPIEYGLGIKRFRLPRLVTVGRRSPTLLGHTGATGSWLFWSPEHDLHLAGTVDQVTAAAVPYRQVPRLVARLAA